MADTPVAAVLERGGVDAVNTIMRTLVRADQPVPEELPERALGPTKPRLCPSPNGPTWPRSSGGSRYSRPGAFDNALPVLRVAPGVERSAKGVKALYRLPGSIPTRADA